MKTLLRGETLRFFGRPYRLVLLALAGLPIVPWLGRWWHKPKKRLDNFHSGMNCPSCLLNSTQTRAQIKQLKPANNARPLNLLLPDSSSPDE